MSKDYLAIKRILVTALLDPNSISELEKFGEVIYEPWMGENGKNPSSVLIYGPEEMAKRIKETEADLLVCESDLCSGPVFESGIKLIASCRSEPTNVDLQGATVAGIPVLFTPGRDADAIAEHTLGLLLALNQRLFSADKEVRTNSTSKKGLPYLRYRRQELKDQVFGIVGLGEVGYAVKWRVEALGMHTLSYDPYNLEAELSLEDVLKNSNVVSMHAPVVLETQKLMGKREFNNCQPGAIYLNTVSSSLHDLDALTNALATGYLGGAGIDCNLEPNHLIMKMDNVIFTPQIAGSSYDTEKRQGNMVVQDLVSLFNGEQPINIANPETCK